MGSSSREACSVPVDGSLIVSGDDAPLHSELQSEPHPLTLATGSIHRITLPLSPPVFSHGYHQSIRRPNCYITSHLNVFPLRYDCPCLRTSQPPIISHPHIRTRPSPSQSEETDSKVRSPRSLARTSTRHLPLDRCFCSAQGRRQTFEP